MKYARPRAAVGHRSTPISSGWIDVNGGDITPARASPRPKTRPARTSCWWTRRSSTKLFLGEDPVGKEVRLNGKPFVVIGVYHALANAFDNGSKRPRSSCPFETARRRLSVSMSWHGRDRRSRATAGDRDLAMDEVDRHAARAAPPAGRRR